VLQNTDQGGRGRALCLTLCPGRAAPFPLLLPLLQDLVYGANNKHAISTTASVTAVFQEDHTDESSPETHFKRTITGKGGSEYRLDGKVGPAV